MVTYSGPESRAAALAVARQLTGAVVLQQGPVDDPTTITVTIGAGSDVAGPTLPTTATPTTGRGPTTTTTAPTLPAPSPATTDLTEFDPRACPAPAA